MDSLIEATIKLWHWFVLKYQSIIWFFIIKTKAEWHRLLVVNCWSTMEDLCQRFPMICRIITNNLDTQSLINFKVSNRNISKCLDEERFYWIRIIKKYDQNFAIYSEQWKNSNWKNSRENCQETRWCCSRIFQSKTFKD